MQISVLAGDSPKSFPWKHQGNRIQKPKMADSGCTPWKTLFPPKPPPQPRPHSPGSPGAAALSAALRASLVLPRANTTPAS